MDAISSTRVFQFVTVSQVLQTGPILTTTVPYQPKLGMKVKFVSGGHGWNGTREDARLYASDAPDVLLTKQGQDLYSLCDVKWQSSTHACGLCPPLYGCLSIEADSLRQIEGRCHIIGGHGLARLG